MEKLINGLMKARSLTLSEMTALLGYQSKTSLVRIMKNKASQRAMDTFVRKINENLELTTLEQKQLAEALECVRWQEDYLSSCEMLKFLRGETVEDAPIRLEDVDSGELCPFAGRYENAEEIRITMLNSQYVTVYQQLLHLIRDKGARVEHFMQMNEGSAKVIHAIHMLVPLIFRSGYAGYCYAGGAEGIQGMRASDVMTVQYRCGEEQKADLIMFDHPGHAFMKTAADGEGFVRLLGVNRSEYTPVKHVYFESSRAQNYIDFCRDYAQLEYNRAIYKIKPDLCMSWIPEDILVDALERQLFTDKENIGELIGTFSEIYHERVRNVYEKRRVTRTILKRSAMVRFARTGVMTDHFWAMRPFTNEERVRILRLIRSHVENNPYFNVYFLKDNDFLRDAEIVYFEDTGITIMDTNTDYTFEGKHSEVMIIHEEFMRMFREYFERCLIAEHVMTGYETLSFFDELIRIAAGDQ